MTLRALFIDFNSYFASVEQQLNPALRGKPCAVVPVMAETTVCIAASYEAKAFGVTTGTKIKDARRLCPDIQFVQANHANYVSQHEKLTAIIHSCAPVEQVRSIDEMWCKLTGTWQQRPIAVGIAQQMKQRIAEQAGECLTSSVGIAPNWFLAKIASNMQKPNGLVVMEQADILSMMQPLKLRDIYGIGAQTEQRFNRYGIHTVEQLYQASKLELHKVYNSINGERLYDLLRGKEVVDPPTKRASISHSHMLPPHIKTPANALAVLHRLLQKAAMRLRKMGYTTGDLSLHIRYHRHPSYKPHTRLTLTDDTQQLTHALNVLWDKRPQPNQRPSMVGLALGHLAPLEQSTGDLFNPPTTRPKLNKALDTINARYGKNTIWYGGAAEALEEAPMRIAFSRIPDINTES